MKCRVCSVEFPDDRKSCPSCGRIITAAERKQYETKAANTANPSVYRPAASKTTTTPSDEAAFVQSLFSTDPNAPEYKDPHSYDSATADVLEYDRTYVSRSAPKQKEKSTENRHTSIFAPSVARDESPTIVPDFDNLNSSFDIEQHDDEYVEQSINNDAENKKRIEKPHLNINPKVIIIAILGIIGVIIIAIGLYKIVDKLNVSTNPNEGISGQSVEGNKNDNEDPDESGYKTGFYTVTSDDDNIVIKNDEERIIATIPNKTVIEITEVDGNFGKTNYGGYKGWVSMDVLTFTPNEKPETTTEPESETEKAEEETTTTPETTTIPETTTENTNAKTYTITLPEGVDALNVRESANAESTPIGIVRNGEKVLIDEINNGWGRIFIGEVEGWINMEYAK